MVPTALWPFNMCPTAVLTATVAITNGHNVVVAVSFETATNPVHISSHISYVFLLCIPTSERVFMMFISQLAKEGITHTTIKVYLAAICYMHVSVGIHQTYNQQLFPYLELVMKGINKETAPWKTSTPVPSH